MHVFLRKSTIRTTIGLLAVAGLLATTGCNIGFEGESGKMGFFYGSDEFSGKKPLAVNSKITVNSHLTEDYEEENNIDSDADRVELTSVSSNNASVIAVEQFGTEENPSEFVLAGNSSGTVDITVEGKTEGGTTVTDGFTMEAKPVKRVELTSPCSPETNDDISKAPVYLPGHTIVVDKTLRGSGNQILTGRGYNPVEVDGPSKKAKLEGPAQDADVLLVNTGDKAGMVTVSPKPGGETLEMAVKKEKAIDAVSATFEKGDGQIAPRFEVDGRPVCDARVDLQIDNQTSDVCSVSASTDEAGELFLGGYGGASTLLTVTPKKKGTCSFDVSVKKSTSGASDHVELKTGPLMEDD